MMGHACPWLIPSRTSWQNTDILPYQSANSCCPEHPKCPLAPGPPAGFSQSPLPHTATNGITAGMAGSPAACPCCCPGPFWRVSAYAVPSCVNLWGSAWPQCQMSAPCGDSHALSSPCQQIFIHTYSVPGPGDKNVSQASWAWALEQSCTHSPQAWEQSKGNSRGGRRVGSWTRGQLPGCPVLLRRNACLGAGSILGWR